MNTPLAMMVAGFSVAQADLGKMFRNLRIYYIAFIKLLLLPVIMTALLMIMRLPSDVASTVLIGTACPAAATGTMMAIRYKQNYTYSSEILLSRQSCPWSQFLQLSFSPKLCYNVPRRRHACSRFNRNETGNMRILILSCNTGEGHNSAGRA